MLPPRRVLMRDLEREVNAITAAMRSHVIPLFVLEGRRVFRCAGSAVLIRTDSNRHFVVTAGHVLDAVGSEPLFTWITEDIGLIRLPCGGALTSQPSGPSRDRDPVDLAAISLDQSTAQQLESSDVSFATTGMLRPVIEPNARLMFVGFPHSLNKAKRSRTSPEAVPELQNVAVIAPAQYAPEGYVRTKADARFNLVAAYDHMSERRTDDPRRPMPHPRGMSGGAVYCLGTSDDPAVALAELRLVGIGTEYHDSLRLFVAAKGASIRRLIRAFDTRG
jgi:hypothetical protein